MAQDKLRIIPLGGLGEFGMNCTALRWQDDIIVIDAGLMFPEEELLGVDIVVPDISYLTENREKVRAIVLTHGHEDHIGGLPWILSELNVPVYGTEFTLALVEGKLDEHRLLDDAELIEILPGRRFTLGPFSIMPIRVTHSLVDCVALAIHTPVGVVVHTRRLQDRPLVAGRQAVRPARLCRAGQAGRAVPAAGLDQRRPARLHAERARGASAAGRDLRADQEEALLQLLLLVDPPHPHCHGAGRRAWAQGRGHRPLAGQLHRDRAGPGLSRPAAGADHQSRPVARHARQQGAGDDLRHAGRADVGALARGGEQPQVRAHRRGRHRGAQLAHHPRQREVDLPHDRPPRAPRGQGHLRRRHAGPDPRQRTRIAGGDAADDQPACGPGSSFPSTATIAT